MGKHARAKREAALTGLKEVRAQNEALRREFEAAGLPLSDEGDLDLPPMTKAERVAVQATFRRSGVHF